VLIDFVTNIMKRSWSSLRRCRWNTKLRETWIMKHI